MKKLTQSNILHIYILLLSVSMLACYNSAWAGVAAYQLDGGTTVPAPISYWLSGDAESVTIEIIDAATKQTVYTFPALTGDDASKGYHSEVVVWDGSTDGGLLAPAGSYKVKAIVVSDMTTTGSKLKPLWESCSPDGSDSTDWRIYGIAMNVNPNSPFYGRVYVGNYTAAGHSKAVHEFNPDGTEISPLQEPVEGFGASAPYALSVDGDDHVYVSDRSDPGVWQYEFEDGAWVPGSKITSLPGGAMFHRYLACSYASSAALKLAFTYQEGGVVKLGTGEGDPPLIFTIGSTQSGAALPMQLAIDSQGATYAAAYRTPPSPEGELQKWDYATKSIVATNPNLTQSMGVGISIDDNTMWLCRPTAFIRESEKWPFYKFPKSQAMTITPSSQDLKKYKWDTVLQQTQSPRFIAVDGESNLAVAGTDGSATGKGSVFGLYAEPTGENTVEIRIGRNTIVKGANPVISGVVTEGVTGKPAAGVTVRASKDGYYKEAITNSNGMYAIDVMPDTGYTVTPKLNIYNNTLPTEYNLRSDWPSNSGNCDWPKIVDATDGSTTANGRVWPLAVTQVTYDWDVRVYRSGGRSVCVMGTVLRQAADNTVNPAQNGYDGYYFITDMLGTLNYNTQQGVKINVFSSGSECKKGDKVVVVGNYDVPLNYRQGIVTPTSTPTILASGCELPAPRDATNIARSSLYGNLIGGYYVMKNMTVTRVGNDEEFYVNVPKTTSDPTPVEFRIGLDTIATTGVTCPAVNQSIDIYGILDEIAPSNTLRELKPGEPGDAGLQGLVNKISEAKAKTDGADVAFEGAQVTGIAGGGIPTHTAFIEQPDRSSGLRVKLPDIMTHNIGAGDRVIIQGRMATTAHGERFVEANRFERKAVDSSARPIDAIGMGNTDARSDLAGGLFIKTWGKVGEVDANSFTISDGSRDPLKVYCGSVEKPETGRVVRVRGIVSKDASGPVLLMRNERVDWQYGEGSYQPIPLPGAYKYPRDFLVLGPFSDANSVSRAYRLDHDFIYGATGYYDETSIEYMAPQLGQAVGSHVWIRSQPIGDSVNFAELFPANHTNCTFYVHLWVYSPIWGDVGMRIGSSDSAKVFVSNTEIYKTSPVAARPLQEGEDAALNCYFYPGLNSVLIKVENGSSTAPGVNIQFVDKNAPGGIGWGGAVPIEGFGYTLNGP